MNANRVLSATALLALATLWIYRDALGQVCNGENEGCYDSVAVPCSAGAGTCAVVSCATIPGGICKCSDGTTALYYTYNPPNFWTDCVHNTNFGPCSRVPMACATVWLYETSTDCVPDDWCGMNQVSACTKNAGQNPCN